MNLLPLIVLLSLACAGDDPKELTTARARYDGQLAEIRLDYDRVAAAGIERYKIAVRKIELEAQKRGDLDGLVLARGELKRLESDSSLPAPPEASGLSGAVKDYWIYVNKSRKQFLRQKARLLKGYIAALDKHQRTFIRGDQLEKAVIIRDARRAAMAEHQRLLKDIAENRLHATPVKKQPKPPPGLPDALRNGLKLHFAFDENDLVKLPDLSGNHHKVTRSIAEWAKQGRRGGAARFDGGEGLRVDEAKDLAFTGAFTIAAWISMREPIRKQREQQFLIGHSDWDSDVGYILLTYMPHSPGINFRGHHRRPGTRDLVWNGAANLNAGEWFHIAAVYDGGMMRLFSNGSEVATKPWKGGFKPNPGPLKIGEDYHGLLDELMMYDRALTAAEIRQLIAYANEETKQQPTPRTRPAAN